jgi:hypothetical protein
MYIHQVYVVRFHIRWTGVVVFHYIAYVVFA